jgi:Mrp family chromosome partitioning ATPase
MDIPKVVVVAEAEVHELLAHSGVEWDVQHPVESVQQMWDDLSAGRLDQQSVAVVFSDSCFARPGELEQAVATMAAHAATFVLAWDADGAEELLTRVRETALAQGGEPDAPVHVLSTSSGRSVLDGIREVLETAPPPRRTVFPDAYALDVDGPIQLAEPQVHQFVPVPVAQVPVPVPPLHLVDVPGVSATPHHALYQKPAAVSVERAAPVATRPRPEPAFVPDAQSTAKAVQAVVSGGFPTPYGQEDPLSRPPLPGQATIAVTSSKGGSGKSTIAMLVAAQIAHSSRLAFEQGLVDRPKKVVLIDLDTRDGQVASLVGQYIPTALNIRVSPDWDEATILANLVHDDRLAIDALLAPVRPRTADDVGPDFYRHVIRMLQRTHDVVVIDTSVNYLDPLISTVCLPEATAILFVTTLATTSVQGMARALQEITQTTENGGMGISRTKIGIVVNQAVTEVGMERDQVLQAALKVPLIGSVPLATKDVLTCTNYNRMHRLLEHPTLGPAYFKLAVACLPGVPLVPIVDEPATATFPEQAVAADAQPVPPVQAVPAAQSASAAQPVAAQPVAAPQPVPEPSRPAETGRKRSLFSRR